MLDKFFFSPTLKSRLNNNSIEKALHIREEFNQHISEKELHNKLVLSQTKQEPIFYAIQKAMPAACLIDVYQEKTGEGTRHWTGSGFLLQKNTIVTSDHILPEKDSTSVIKVSFGDNNKHVAEIGKSNSELDIAILTVENVDINPVPVAKNTPIIGEKIAVIGAPEGWENIVTVGYVSAVDMTPAKFLDNSWTNLIFIDSDIYEGSSGSMVINTMGEVIGVVMGIIGKNASDKNIGQNAVIPIYKVLDMFF